MKRIYETLLSEHFGSLRQMAFLAGPRQVGKTTLARAALPDARYFSYDNADDAATILRGQKAVADALSLSERESRPGQGEIVFDEIHKFPRWKQFLKGFFDVYGDNRKLKIAVTGSARLDIYKRGGDSMMGRYFRYRIHPLSAGEVVSPDISMQTIFPPPKAVGPDAIEALLRFGGYPEPFLNGTDAFRRRWGRLRLEQLFHEDLRTLNRVQDVRQILTLAELLRSRVCGGVNATALASDLSVSPPTVAHWISVLESLFYCFEIRPWHRNVASSIRKQPKLYLWDWSEIADPGARRENFVAAHLLKAVHWWEDAGLGDFGLFYLRDKAQHEADFLVTKDEYPFFMVECKSSASAPLAPGLIHFFDVLKPKIACQVDFERPISDFDITTETGLVRIGVADLLKALP